MLDNMRPLLSRQDHTWHGSVVKAFHTRIDFKPCMEYLTPAQFCCRRQHRDDIKSRCWLRICHRVSRARFTCQFYSLLFLT